MHSLKGYWDGHVHTNFSDGDYMPSEIVRIARAEGLEAIAVTDHDTVGGVEQALEAGKSFNIKVIPAIEVSCKAKDASKGYAGIEVHILGFGIDYKRMLGNPTLLGIKEARVKRAAQQLELYRQQGISLEITPEETRGFRPPIVKERFRQKHGMSVQEGLDKLGLDFVGKEMRLLLSETGPEGFAYAPYDEGSFVTPEEAAQLIINYSGIAVLAHPGEFIDKYARILKKKGFPAEEAQKKCQADLTAFITALTKEGMRGLEVYSPKNSPELIPKLELLADKLGLVRTFGTDYHGLETLPDTRMGSGINDNILQYNNPEDCQKLISLLG